MAAVALLSSEANSFDYASSLTSAVLQLITPQYILVYFKQWM